MRGGGTDKERDRRYEWKLTVMLHHHKCAAHLQKTCEISGLLADNGVDITLLSARSTQIPRGPLADTNVSMRQSRFQIPRLKSIILNLIAALSGYTSYSVSTSAFLTLPVSFKLQYAQ